MSQDYANSSGTSGYFYLDTGDTTLKDGGDTNYNKKKLLFVVLLFWPVKYKIQ